MMSWNHVILLFLIVFLSMINMSKGECNNYFTMEDLNKSLTDTISIVKTKNPKDAIECTLEREFLNNQTERQHLFKCFRPQKRPEGISDKCKGEPSQNITLYHFKCLTAKALQLTAEDIGHTGCEYDTVLEIYSHISKGFGHTILLPPTTTTAPPPPPTTTTTAPPTTTTAAPPPPTTTTTAPPPPTTTTTTAPTTTLPERTTASAASTTVLSPTPTAVSGITGSSSEFKGTQETSNTDTSRMLLLISVTLNVLLPLAVYLYMRSQRSQDYRPPTELNGASPDDQPMTEMELNSQPTPVNRDKEEASHLMQSSNNPHHEQALGNSGL